MIRHRLAVAAVFSACSSACSINTSSAYISEICPGGVTRTHLHVTKATDDWHWNPHGGFGNTVESYSFDLPYTPTQTTTFVANQVQVTEFLSLSKDPGQPTAGEITVDTKTHTLVIALATAEGNFPANGTYQVSLPTNDVFAKRTR